jgi:hypothetical protein
MIAGLNPGTIYWTVVSEASSYYSLKKNENNGSQMEHIKKKYVLKLGYNAPILTVF